MADDREQREGRRKVLTNTERKKQFVQNLNNAGVNKLILKEQKKESSPVLEYFGDLITDNNPLSKLQLDSFRFLDSIEEASKDKNANPIVASLSKEYLSILDDVAETYKLAFDDPSFLFGELVEGATGNSSILQKIQTKRAKKEAEQERVNKKLLQDSQLYQKIRRLNEQCYLIDNWDKLIKETSDELQKYRNIVVIDGDPVDISHKFSAKTGIVDLFNVTPAQVSLLMPKMKLYKQYINEDGNAIGEREVLFHDHTENSSIEDITAGIAGRTSEVGLQGFNYELTSINPAARHDANVEFRFYFQDFNQFGREINNENYSALKDLIFFTREGRSSEEERRIWNADKYKIKVVTGWQLPSDPNETLFNNSLKLAIQKSNLVMNLTLYKHDLEFNDDGTLTMTAMYRSAMHSFLDSPAADVLNPSQLMKKQKEETSQRQQERLKKIDEQILKNSEDFFDLIENETLRIQIEELDDRQTKYSRIIDKLVKEGRIYYIDVDKHMIDVWNDTIAGKLVALSKGEEPKITQRQIQIAAQQEILKRQRQNREREDRGTIGSVDFVQDLHKKQLEKFKVIKITPKDKNRITPINTLLQRTEEYARDYNKQDSSKNFIKKTELSLQPVIPKDTSKRRINYIYFGDIVDSIASILKENNKQQNLHVILGPISFKRLDFNSQGIKIKSKKYNLADIPISLNEFSVWFANNVVALRLGKYPFHSFIQNMIEKLVMPSLGENCYFSVQFNKNDIHMRYFSIPGKGKNGEIPPVDIQKDNKEFISRKSSIKINDIKNHVWKDSAKLHHYLYFFVTGEHDSDSSGRNAIRKQDEAEGIYHLHFGRDRGLVRNIKFSKIDDPLFATAQYMNQTSGKNSYLREVYNVQIEMVGNSLFEPQTMFFLDTTTLGLGRSNSEQSLASKLGIGGYYIVTKVEHNYEIDDYITTITAKSTGYDRRGKDKIDIAKIAEQANKDSRLARSVLNLAEGKIDKIK